MKVYAVDFDGTLCEGKYPLIGEPKQDIIDYVKSLQEDGHKIILYTCRTGDKLDEAVQWCKDHGITFDAVNENLKERIEEYGTDPRKISADYYIDDKNLKLDDCVLQSTVSQSSKEVKRISMSNQKFWELKQKAELPDTLELYIYSDVQADYFDWWDWETKKSETSAEYFREQLEAYKDVKRINIYINSLGGSVLEGVAIHNQLKRHPAHKTVYVDGFACSIASVIAMAGDTVVMPKNTVMMIHNAWTYTSGNAAQLRKQADDLDVLNEAFRQAYLLKSGGKITEDKLCELLDAESYLTAAQCMEYGFADEFAEVEADVDAAKQMLQQAKEEHITQYASRLERVCALAQPPKTQDPPENKAEKIIMSYFK